ncbi:YceI family protein [Campylobacter sputorum]|uniref:YceI family protein n=1 Tax=Campylobacter sputorum TaxID=206 RepID=UPI000B77A13A|nr:YceI family protein [Campylobacter sputorum]ASM36574.1 putative periplasmic protein (YceI-like domain) [Campylobacter sputorum bv. faecalis CCUG 20703]
MKKMLLAFITTAFFASSALFAAQYSLDNAHTSVGFKIKHMQISNVKGDFTDFNALIDFDESKKQPLKMDAVIKITSIDTGTQKRDDHLRSAEYFDAKKFPDMKFVMKEFIADGSDEGKIKGDLTIKNITKPVTLDYEFGGITKDSNGKNKIGFSLEGKIDRTEFGVGEKSVMLGDEVKIQVEVEAVEK